MKFTLEQNLFTSPGESWHHIATFKAESNLQAQDMASRWARRHGGASVRVKPTSKPFELDEFMETFRP